MGWLALPAMAFHARMELDPQVVRVGEAAELRIVVEGVRRGVEPQLPPIPGLRITGPHTESSMQLSWVDGRREQAQSITYRYRVLPAEAGEFTIGPITYQAGGQTVELAAQTLQVVGRENPTGERRDVTLDDLVFARLTVSRDEVYVNQDFTLEFAIYSRDINLGRDISLQEMPESGLQIQPYQELQRMREVVDGEIYDVRRYRTTVRPLTAGTVRFAPQLRVQILVPRDRPRRGFFDDPFFRGAFADTEAHPHTLSVETVEVAVRSLPTEARPANFTGGVGRFEFDVNVHPRTVQVGDPLTVTMRLAGEGNIDTIGAPAVEDSDHFRVFAPRVAHTDIERGGRRGRKTFEQVVIPRTMVATTIPALTLYYFDPEAETFRAVTRGPFTLELEASDEVAPRTVRGVDRVDGVPRVVGQDIAYLQSTPVRWRRLDEPRWYRQPWFWALQGLPPLALLAVYVAARRRRALQADPAKARRYRAPRAARPGLRQAAGGLSRKDTEAFYSGLWQGLSAYFGDRLNLPPGAVTLDVVQAELRQAGADDAALSAIQHCFEACEQWRFARSAAAEPARMRTLLKECRSALRTCERISR